MSQKNAPNTLKYYGWSTVLVESEQGGDLVFDPFFTPDYETYWADLRDFEKVSVICLSHGHHEHYTNAHMVAARSGAKIVAPPRLCRHLEEHFGVPRKQLVEIIPHGTVEVSGYTISAFPWYHRKINYFKFFAGKFLTGCRFVLSNLLHTPLDTPFTGFAVTTPEGMRLLNLTEGMNDKMPGHEVRALGEKYKPDVVLGGYQLRYEAEVARCVKDSGAPACLLYHPHGKLFDLMKLYSTPVEDVCKLVRQVAPEITIYAPEPRETVAVATGA